MTKVSWKSVGMAGLAVAIAVSMASLLAARGTAAAPVNSVQIEPAAAVVAPGGAVSVNVVAGAPATKLGGWQLLVSFDKTVVEPADLVSPCLGTVSECVVLPGGDAVRVQGFSQSGLSGTVTLAEIPFRAVGAAGSSTAVSIQVVEFIDVADGSATNPAVTGGTITIQATPTPPTCYTLSTGVNPPGSGYVSADPASSGGCSYGQYGPGSSVQLTGVANSGWQFQNWSGDCSGAANPTAVTMTGDKSCTANFTDNTISIMNYTIAQGGSVTVAVNASVSPELLGAANVEVDYDPAVIDATGCTRDPGFDSGDCNPNFGNDGTNPDTVIVLVSDPQGASGDLHLADITFQAVGPSGACSALHIRVNTFVSGLVSPMAYTTSDGQICIAATPAPTHTATPMPTPTHAATPTHTLSPSPTPSPAPEPQFSNGDIDCDGDVDSVDALKVLRHVAGMSVSQIDPCPDIGSTAALGGSAPEPLLAGVGLTGAVALAVGALVIGNRRRREDAEE